MNKSMTIIALLFIALAGLSVFPGCSDNPLGTVKVSGTVTVDGALTEGVNVSFIPTGGEGRESYGITDAQGKFVLTIPGTEPGSGTMPGEYRVIFTKETNPMAGINLEGMEAEEIEREMAKRFPRGLPSPENLLPAKYADRNATDIAPVTVEKGKKNDFAFALSSK